MKKRTLNKAVSLLRLVACVLLAIAASAVIIAFHIGKGAIRGAIEGVEYIKRELLPAKPAAKAESRPKPESKSKPEPATA